MSALEKYTFKRFGRLKKLLKSYSSDPQMETLHGIRVEIKKVKAILQLIDNFTKRFHPHRHFTPLRDIFRKAGQIRQPQVFYELLLRYEIQGLSDSFIPGSGMQAVLSRRFRREVPVYLSVVNTRKKKLEKFLGKIKEDQIRKFLKKRKEALQRMLRGNLSVTALHKSRKVMKEILYLEGVAGNTSKSKERLGQLEERIGHWHDQQLLLEILAKGKSTERERVRLESDRAKRDIKKAVSDLYPRK